LLSCLVEFVLTVRSRACILTHQKEHSYFGLS
jgi:hypothetical protein